MNLREGVRKIGYDKNVLLSCMEFSPIDKLDPLLKETLNSEFRSYANLLMVLTALIF